MSEMVERIAKTILAKVPQGYGMTKGEAIEYARATIAAMRVPTEAMLDAGYGNAGEETGSSQPANAIWQAMIDAALK